ncbi:MAG TPA: GGDEF domain-containing protein [Ureibacillus sp.]|nr:GGDEF domain-containing protein [Ureibacillus sp.]
MDLLLDTKTILITLVIGHLFTVVLISSYWRSHFRDRTFNTFFLAKCIQALAWFLSGFRGALPDLFTIPFANSLQIIGTALESIALLKLVNGYVGLYKKFYISLTITFIVIFHMIYIFYNVETIRIFCSSITTAIIAILPAYHLVRGKSSTLLMKLMGFLYYLVGISFLIRGIFAISSKQEMGLFTPGFIQTLSLLSIYLIMIVGNIGFILILKERADAELVHMAYYDDLTQALNRRTFVARAKQDLVQSAKAKSKISFILFDIDHFKHFNDSYGHEAGDRILQDLSHRIHQSLDSNFLFGRYGGDEFAILLTGLSQEETEQRLNQATDLIEQAELEGISEKYSISLGVITLIPDKDTTLESLYVSCDKALYEAKHKGRNCICFGHLQEVVTQ